ncbi:nascent polypeptide-associated complex subunit alpha, muscle-specific form-like isoform X1 [Eriocheir sinensis]|uniref:nascent polypeptide-associated complex subunit alpha, muscle-specific form-like isoform X1 n=1 Tax=Eriocheir sinensis TaxID=95602 RepID=UPI0021C56B0E|nr:nascent polypeptide-associated complex subunit alpha, muscle-specific form-like isoform X1 [Eriocheir sinensis]
MRAMTDLDTPGAVVWPKWCYSSKSAWYHSRNQVEGEAAQDLALNNNTPITKDKEQAAVAAANAAAAAAYGTKGRKKVRREVLNGTRVEERMPSDSTNDVKSERLSPDPGSDAPATTHATPSPSVSPKSPASHRTRTPSFPGTPPNPAFTPPAAITTAYDRFSPASLGGVGGLPGGPGAIKQMESLMNRNCSDLMRSLAAKYNHSNPNDYFSSPNNGFLRHPLSGLASYKHGSAPFLGVPAPPTTSASAKDTDKKIDAVPVSTAAGIAPLPHPAAPPMFPGAAGLPGFPGFPLVDMSSSQVLLNMVRNASATQQSQLENYLRGAMKRPADAPTSPLDLSASMATKRPRTEPSKSFDVKTLFGLQHEEEKKLETKAHTTRSPTPPKPRPTPSPGSHKPPTPCSDKNCPSLETIGHWTVDDVCSFVGSIELCAEYVEAFREQRIDGSALPLLTEEHLTSSINMKLGPALKLRSVLARRLGACNVCLHCDHCHSQTQERRPSSASSGQ